MWAVNYIKCVRVGGSHNDVTIKCGHMMLHADGPGANVLKNVWKTKITYEIKLHGGQDDDIHDEKYH